MRIAGQIGFLMMDAMRSHPGDRSSLERQGATDRKKILESQRHFIRPVRVQAMVTHADAQTGGHPIEKNGNDENLPTEYEQRSHRPNVEKRHKKGDRPIHLMAVGYPELGSAQ